MNSIISKGMSKTVINNQGDSKVIEDTQYMGIYDGKNANILMRNGNEGIYVGLDEKDLAGLFKNRQFGEKNKKSLEKKLEDTLKKKHRTLKKSSSSSSSRGKKTRNKRKKVKKVKKKGLIKKNKKRKTKTKKRRKNRKNKNTIKKNRSYKDIITPTDDIFD
jgi:primosomal protein N'